MRRSSALALVIALGLPLCGEHGTFSGCSTRLEAAAAKVILVDDDDSACQLIGTWADNYGNNPEGANFSGDGTVKNRYHYTSSHGKYARTGKEKAIFTPTISKAGTYKVEVGFRGSANRSPKVTYEVTSADGKQRKTISQQTDDNWAELGLFSFQAGREGNVAMVSDGGKSASVDAARFTLIEEGTATAPETNPGQTGGLGDLLPPAQTDGSAVAGGQIIRLDHRNPGQKTFTLPCAGMIRLTPYLHTFGAARISVVIKRAAGGEDEVLSWKRSNDADGSPLEVSGKEFPESMREVKPGDFSPATPKAHEFQGNQGDEVILLLEGEFGQGRPFLKMEFQKQ